MSCVSAPAPFYPFLPLPPLPPSPLLCFAPPDEKKESLLTLTVEIEFCRLGVTDGTDGVHEFENVGDGDDDDDGCEAVETRTNSSFEDRAASEHPTTPHFGEFQSSPAKKSNSFAMDVFDDEWDCDEGDMDEMSWDLNKQPEPVSRMGRACTVGCMLLLILAVFGTRASPM